LRDSIEEFEKRDAQLLAIAQVRRLTAVHVYSRTPERRTAFADRMSAALSLPVEAVDTAEKAVRDADIVVTITSAREPVAQGAWLAPGTHINAVGAFTPEMCEIPAGGKLLQLRGRNRTVLPVVFRIVPFQRSHTTILISMAILCKPPKPSVAGAVHGATGRSSG